VATSGWKNSSRSSSAASGDGRARIRAADARGQGAGRLGAEHGGAPGEPDGGGAEPLQPVDESAALHRGGELAQFGDVRRLRLEPSVGDLGGEFDGLEGVAAGDRPCLTAEAVVRVLTQGGPDEAAHRAGCEGDEVEGVRSVAFGEARERGSFEGEFVRPVRHDEQHRQVVDPGREAGEPGQGLGVRPVGVVEHDHQRRVLHGDAGGEPVQAVTYALRVGDAVARSRDQAHRGGDDVVPTAQQFVVFLLGGRRQERLDELAYDMERHALFLLPAAGVEHRAAAGDRLAADFGEERGLAETRRSGEGEQPAGAGRGRARGRCPEIGQQRVHRGELGVAFQQRPALSFRPVPDVGHI
jgi:hypothetical protein